MPHGDPLALLGATRRGDQLGRWQARAPGVGDDATASPEGDGGWTCPRRCAPGSPGSPPPLPRARPCPSQQAACRVPAALQAPRPACPPAVRSAVTVMTAGAGERCPVTGLGRGGHPPRQRETRAARSAVPGLPPSLRAGASRRTRGRRRPPGGRGGARTRPLANICVISQMGLYRVDIWSLIVLGLSAYHLSHPC